MSICAYKQFKLKGKDYEGCVLNTELRTGGLGEE